MSPRAIHSLIDMFGVEHGVKILNLFTTPTDAGKITRNLRRPRTVKKRPKDRIREAELQTEY